MVYLLREASGGRPMQDREAAETLDARIKAGGKLVVAQRSDLPTIKALRERCHAAGIPTLLGPGTHGG
jgi:hypothetical protein